MIPLTRKLPQKFRWVASLALSAWLLTPVSHAEGVSADRMIAINAEFAHATKAQLKNALAAASLAELPGQPLSPAQFEIVKDQLKKNRVEFFNNLRTVMKNGTRVSVNAVREVRYPSQYAPSETKRGQSIPTAFETRNAGVELEVEATVGPKDIIDLTVGPAVTTFLGFIDFTGAKPARADGGETALDELLKAPLTEGGIWLPVFSTFKTITMVSVRDGETVMLGGPMEADQVKPPAGQSAPAAKKSDQQVFVFVTAKIVEPN